MAPLTVPRKSLPLLVVAVAVALFGCGSPTSTSTPPTTGGPADGGQGGAAAVAAIATTCGEHQASYQADTTDGAVVKGGSGSNLGPTINDIIATLAAQTPPIGSSQAIASLMPIAPLAGQGQYGLGTICANGDVYLGGQKVASQAELLTRIPTDDTTMVVMSGDQAFYRTPAAEAFKEPGIDACPALIATYGTASTIGLIKAVCLDNYEPVIKAVV